MLPCLRSFLHHGPFSHISLREIWGTLCLLRLKQNCHPDRSVAERRDLLFYAYWVQEIVIKTPAALLTGSYAEHLFGRCFARTDRRSAM
jgi:hypothetical protein